jgi:septum formation protein
MTHADQTIYLASKSPRRRELLRQIGVTFELLLLRETPGREGAVSEDPLPGEAPDVYVSRIARLKAQAGREAMLARRLLKRPVLSADTTVTVDGLILGKPQDADDALHMLRKLCGRTHEVLTAVAVFAGDELIESLSRSEVHFADVGDDALRAYCASGEPLDKAGSYGVQGRAAQFITHISGSYSGIMGLPLYETASMLNRAGISTL